MTNKPIRQTPNEQPVARGRIKPYSMNSNTISENWKFAPGALSHLLDEYRPCLDVKKMIYIPGPSLTPER